MWGMKHQKGSVSSIGRLFSGFESEGNTSNMAQPSEKGFRSQEKTLQLDRFLGLGWLD